jgi:hypothetical protein
MSEKMGNKTSRQWLISLAKTKRRLHNLSGHAALEAVYDESRAPHVGDKSLLKFAAGAYESITQKQLEKLIRAVEK